MSGRRIILRKRPHNSDDDDDSSSESLKRKKIVHITPVLEPYTKKIESIQQLLQLIEENKEYSNISLKKLKNMKEELKELDELIGMKSLKKSVLNQILYYIQGLHIGGDDYLHTVIYGNPGQGKTTVAKILGKIFSKLGILKRNSFTIAQREDLIAGYLGQTALKTRAVLEVAKKGVLFIDEIYSLGDRENRDSFSKECIDTINIFLSENKHEFMLIVAGYEKEIEECFFSQNQGLKRRFMWYHTIEEYSPEDLGYIFMKKVKDNNWKVDEEVSIKYLEEIFEKNKDKFKNAGGDIENFLTLSKINHGVRSFTIDESKKKILTKGDIEDTMKDFNVKKEKKDDPPPLMYI